MRPRRGSCLIGKACRVRLAGGVGALACTRCRLFSNSGRPGPAFPALSGTIRHQPSQVDMLQVDIWHNGRPVTSDGGSFPTTRESALRPWVPRPSTTS